MSPNNIWTPFGDYDSDKISAEKQWRERDRHEAQKAGFEAEWQGDFGDWLEVQQPEIQRIGKSTGAPLAARSEFTALLAREQAKSPQAGVYEISTRAWIDRLIAVIESTCNRLRVPIRNNSVVSGMSPELGVAIGQTRVLDASRVTNVSIIRATASYFLFYNTIAKLLARSLLHDGTKIIFNRELINNNVRSSPGLVTAWTMAVAQYAAFGRPPENFRILLPKGPAMQTCVEMVDAHDLFAVAHEYGHHALNHDTQQTGEDRTSNFRKEFDADYFSQFISQAVARSLLLSNRFALFGGGAVISLCANDILMRAKSVLSNGLVSYSASDSHPPTASRIQALGRLDFYLSAEHQLQAGMLRVSLFRLFKMIWAIVLPGLVECRACGLRPVERRNRDAGGWLPN